MPTCDGRLARHTRREGVKASDHDLTTGLLKGVRASFGHPGICCELNSSHACREVAPEKMETSGSVSGASAGRSSSESFATSHVYEVHQRAPRSSSRADTPSRYRPRPYPRPSVGAPRAAVLNASEDVGGAIVAEFTDGQERVQGDTWKYTSTPSARVRTRHIS